MTRFDPTRQHKDAVDWSVLAYQTADEDRAAQTLVIGLAVGTAIASVTTPVLGGVIGAYFVIKSVQKAFASDKNKKYIRNAGCVAHVLDDGHFRSYLSQVGNDAVMSELRFAEQEGLSFSNDALDFYEDWQESSGTNQLPSAPTRVFNPTPTTNTAITQTVADTYDGNRIDIIGSMTDRVSNSFILGIAGSGKGVLLSHAMRQAKFKHPLLKIFYIDPKSDEREFGYTDGVADVVKRYKCETESPETVVKWLKSCFDEFDKFAAINAAKGDRTLLILDEGTVLGLKSKLAKSTILIDRLSSLTSLGDSSGKNVWFVAQTPFVGGSGIDLSASSQLVTIALVSAENLGSLGQWKKSAMFTQPKDLEDLINKSGCKRAVYFGKTGQWYSMPKLTNYSGYDRDTRTDNREEIVTDKFQAENVVIQLEKIFSQDAETELHEDYEHLLASKVIEIVSKSNDSVSLNAIRISKMWERDFSMSLPSRSDVKDAVNELMEKKILIGNEALGYRLTNNN